MAIKGLGDIAIYPRLSYAQELFVFSEYKYYKDNKNMEENTPNLEEAKAALQKQMEEMKNKTYPDWDSIVVQLNQGDKVALNIRMMRQDMEAMSANHGQVRADIMELMVAAMEDQINNPEPTPEIPN